MDFAFFFKLVKRVLCRVITLFYNSSHQFFNESKADELQAFTQLNSASRLLGLPQMFLLLKVMETSWIISYSK